MRCGVQRCTHENAAPREPRAENVNAAATARELETRTSRYDE
jgi:hypothetical protein